MRTVCLLCCLASTLAAGELAVDGGFEDDVVGMAGPAASRWGRFASVEPMGLQIVEDPRKASNQALRIEARPEAGAYQGVFQAVEVTEGKSYVVSVKALNDPGLPLEKGSQAVFSVEWRDAAGDEIGREDGHPWAELGDRDWEEITFATTAPAGASRAHFVILQRNPEHPEGPTGGALLIDNFSIQNK